MAHQGKMKEKQSPHEIKSSLRKLEYPICAREALVRIETLILNLARSKQDLIMDLIAEFIFCEREEGSSRGYTRTVPQLSLLQEFQLVICLCDFLSKPNLVDATRNAVFLSLFGGTVTPSRIAVLVKLASTAISGQIQPVLGAVGTLMQQLGCSSAPSLELAQALVKDFIVFATKTSDQLKSLPKIAPRFAANFMTAVAGLYLGETNLAEPPDLLLELFTEWVTETPSLCFASQRPLNLPPGAIAMPVVTPLSGLIRWSCVSALITDNACYNKLHLSVLHSLLQAAPQTGPPSALNAQHLAQAVSIVQARVEEAAAAGRKVEEDERIQKCLERFAQAVQVALAGKVVYGPIPQFLCRLEVLPNNPLLQIVIKNNKQT